MPRQVTPAGMPDDMARVVDVMTNAVRTEILRHLTRAPLTAVELAEATSIPHSSISRHLRVMQSMGLVAPDHPNPAQRGRTKVRWHVERERVWEIAQTWARYALDEIDAPPPADG